MTGAPHGGRRHFVRVAVVGLLLLVSCGRTVVHESDEDDGELTRLAFDPGTVETMRGRIVEVDGHQRISGNKNGVRVRLATDGEEIYVYLAPQGYFDEVSLELRPGQLIEVRGSILDGDDRRVMIAGSLTVGIGHYPLRDAEGRPKWREWRSDHQDAEVIGASSPRATARRMHALHTKRSGV